MDLATTMFKKISHFGKFQDEIKSYLLSSDYQGL